MLQDMVIPAFKPPADVASSPLLGGPVLERTHLLFFRGDVGLHRLPNYSRGIRQEAHACLAPCCRASPHLTPATRRCRQALYNLSKVHQWREKHDIVIASGDVEAPGSYSEWLATSKFCLVAPGTAKEQAVPLSASA